MKLDFISDDFLLETPQARRLFHEYASGAPVVDYHNHLSVKEMCADRQYDDIGQLWVSEDRYKHRAMRLCGIDECLITGDSSSYEKFMAWCSVLPRLVGNPLFHWSCIEMKKVFGVDELPSADNADEIWKHCNALLSGREYTTNSILRGFGVVRLSTSDDILDDVSLHDRAAEASGIDVTPSLRADSALAFDGKSFRAWLRKLSPDSTIVSLSDYLVALKSHLDCFASHSCVLADHALDNAFRFVEADFSEVSETFGRLLDCKEPDGGRIVALKSFVLGFLAREYARRGWVMQLHIGAERWTSTRLREAAGPAGGFACPGNSVDLKSLCRFLDSLDRENLLPKTILYTLNPTDNAMLATLTGSFGLGDCQKLQFGPAWWYNDHKCGIMENLAALSSYSILFNSIGMTTDSRTILSFSRHEYFRRILCNFLGGMIARGELPDDFEFVGQAVRDISYRNADKWVYNK